MTTFKWLTLIAIAAIVPALPAETRCPGNVASLPFHLVNRHQIVMEVSVNHAGPFSFLLDTGTQITMLDQSLASELHLKTDGEAAVAGVGFHESASFAQLDQVEAGSHSVANTKALVYDLSKIRAADRAIRGILGEDFLEKFDMLIDYAHNQICLDDTAAMRSGVKGQRIGLLTPDQPAEGQQLVPASLIVTAKLTDGMRPVRLKLDSGADVPFLYSPSEYLAIGISHTASLHGGGAGGAQQSFSALPPQSVKLGSAELERVSFLSVTGARKDSHTAQFDGLLPTGLFRRIFIDHEDHFVVLEP